LATPVPQILVLAGVNGAGKSSVGGAALRQRGAVFYDPDRAARRYREAGLAPDEANARAWEWGRDRLEQSIGDRTSFAFETTLGGRTITQILVRAALAELDVRVWYVGLASPELHIRRVRERVARGGHDIPESLIRMRWESSRENLVRLMPRLAELALFDNSAPGDPLSGGTPDPLRILHARGGVIRHLRPPGEVPSWARPIVAAAFKTWQAE
jgi:predicted ABC-type ATPase